MKVNKVLLEFTGEEIESLVYLMDELDDCRKQLNYAGDSPSYRLQYSLMKKLGTGIRNKWGIKEKTTLTPVAKEE